MDYRNAERVIDISDHQGTVYPNLIKNAGVTTVMLRCAYSVWKDDMYNKARDLLFNSGIRLGSYMYHRWHYEADNQGSVGKARVRMHKEVELFLKHIDKTKITSWVAIDQELERGQKLGISKHDNTILLNEEADIIRKAGYPPCLYCSASWLSNNIEINNLKMKVWVAWYYNDPADPTFTNCDSLADLNRSWAPYIKSLGDKIIGWQFGRIGYGKEYGVESANLDKDWFYAQPEDTEEINMSDIKWGKVVGKRLLALSDKPKCESFPEPNVNSGPVIIIPASDSVKILEVSTSEIAIPGTKIKAPWFKVQMHSGIRYCYGLDDRWKVVDEPIPQVPEKPDVSDVPFINRCQVTVSINDLTKEQFDKLCKLIK